MTNTMSGKNLRAVQAAMPEIESKKLNIELYNLTVVENKDSYSIILIDRDVSPVGGPGLRGNPGKIPGFEVEVSKPDLKVIRGNFIK